jgi:arylsulfatase A-like enzyme
MNFQAVNSAKKASTTSGYADSSGTPDAILLGALSYVDNKIGSMISAFPPGESKKTAIIITAKHGESPVGNQRTIVLTNLIGGILTAAGIPTHKITQKTSALIWLTDQTQTAAAVAALNASPVLAPNLHEVLSFGSPDFPFPDPTVDPAVPDIVVVMNDGVNFEPSLTSTTYAEHGGFGENETHVPLLISNREWTGSSLTCTVSTRQIAPTVLKLLGLDPNALQAVQIEGTSVLPFTCP